MVLYWDLLLLHWEQRQMLLCCDWRAVGLGEEDLSV